MMLARRNVQPLVFIHFVLLILAACGGEESSPSGGDGNGGAENAGTPASNAPAAGGGAGTSPAAPNEPGPSPSSPPSSASSGCGATGGLAAGNNDLTITSGGKQRTARVHVPQSYDAKKPTAVVINFHGRMSDPSQEETVSKMTPKADAAGFVVVYPTGVGQTWNAGLCCGEAQSQNIDDVGFTRDLLDELGKKLCVDTKRVFATGLSNGAYMANRLGCDLSDRIAAIGPVAGQLMMSTCATKRAVPVMYFHGDADPIVSYQNNGWPGAQDSAKAWAERNGCALTTTQTYSKGDATCATYSSCKDNADVTLCTISGGGHTWPGGTPVPFLGKTSQDIDATSAMWDFFTKHPMP
jgi:polyhydroxybutyrate depolymerase